MTSFSFIIPTFNSESDLLMCVKSLSKLKYDKQKFEIIIVDDGSVDGSIAKINKLKLSNLRTFRTLNQGAAGARNYGIEKAKSSILIFLDEDIIVKEDLLAVYENAFETVGADVVQGNVWEQLIDNNLTKVHAKWRRSVFMSKAGYHNGFIKTLVTRNVAVKSDALVKIKQEDGYIFNEMFKGTGGEDRELGYRLQKAGFKIYLESKAIVKHKDPIDLIHILIQKYMHAQGDVRLGIGERMFDLDNFKRVVVLPYRNENVPINISFSLWLFHVFGAEIQRIKQCLNQINIWVYYKFKRFIDIFSSVIGLMIGSPILFLIFLFIKIDSRGPAIFKQKRVSIGWKEFEMFKFRTMIVNAEEILQNNLELLKIYKKSNYKIKDDPRVTRVGKILRKFSLDELPQLINILKGEMSLVGPRAYKKDEIKNQLKIHPELNKYAQLVIGTKPGLTGIWQVSGRSEVGFEKRFIMDYGYASKRNILFDFLIILKTIPVVLKSKGAW